MKNNKVLINLIIIMLIAGMSVLSVLLGSLVSENIKLNEKDNIDLSILHRINESSYGLYHSLHEKKENKDINPSEYLINDKTVLEYENIEEYKRRIDEELPHWYSNLNDNLKNLEYYAVDKDGKNIEKATKNNIEVLLDKNINKNDIYKFKKNYRFYLAVVYDENGRETIINSYGVDNKDFLNTSIKNDYRVSSIKDTKFVYAVPKNLTYEDSISQLLTERDKQLEYTFLVGLVFSVIIFIAVMAISYIREKEFVGFKLISSCSLEFILFIFFIIGIMSIGFGVEVDNSLFSNIDEGTKYAFTNIFYFIGVFSMLSIVFLASLLFKHIMKIGIKKYTKENVLIFRGILYIWSLKDFIKGIDLKEESSIKIMMAVGVNFLVISILCLTGEAGIFLGLIYSAFLFYVIYDNVKKIRKDYRKLFDITNEIANGNLNIQTNENFGVFNAFKGEIEKIQVGLKTAVDKEVKSQKMKTELISNVSHDLKTPLTSIITYIDLLKDENLSKDKQQKYLEVLEQKSQRFQYLIEDLFEMSKATSGNIMLNKVEVDVVSLMKQTLLELDYKIKASSLIIKNNFSDKKILLDLDSNRTFRVFENLIINITKYAMKGSRVYINIDDDSDNVSIIFKNIAENEIDFTAEDVIERFARGDKARNTEGSGLGLSIAKSFVELQGGSFEIKIDGDLFKVIIRFKK